MKTINAFFAILIACTTLFTIGCTKDESFVSDAAETTELENLPTTPEETLVWLKDNGVDLEAHDHTLHEGFRPHAAVTNTKKIYMDIDGEPTEVEAQIIDGYVVVEGDIVLGTEEEVANDMSFRGSVHSSASRRWPNRTIPFEIDPSIIANFPFLLRFFGAVNQINAKTNLTLVQRTNQTDYVRVYLSSNGNFSTSVGKAGGKQEISLTSNAPLGTIIHEFLHAAGVWHEQSRCDRNKYVTIQWGNIPTDSNTRYQFGKRCSTMTSAGTNDRYNGQDVGRYDLTSVMHYPSTAFSTNGAATIVPNLTGLFPIYNNNFWTLIHALGKMGQRDGMSAGDIATVNAIYR